MTVQQFVSQINMVLDHEFPEEEEISTVAEAENVHNRLINCRVELMLNHGIHTMPHYRGEQFYGWDILPGIFRPPFHNGFGSEKGKEIEKDAISIFEEKIKEQYGEEILIRSDEENIYIKQWDLLMQAQHAGIKTTFIDWSDFIQTANFFAIEFSADFDKVDGQLWAFMIPVDWVLGPDASTYSSSFYDYNPFELTSHIMVNPSTLLDDIDKRIFEYRYFKQGGRFFVAANEVCHVSMNEMPFIKDLLIRFRIPADSKSKLQNELRELKITRSKYYIEETEEAETLIHSVNQKLESLR